MRLNSSTLSYPAFTRSSLRSRRPRWPPSPRAQSGASNTTSTSSRFVHKHNFFLCFWMRPTYRLSKRYWKKLKKLYLRILHCTSAESMIFCLHIRMSAKRKNCIGGDTWCYLQSVEKFIQKCRNEYKIPGLYVIDSIVRQSRHQFGPDKDVFAPRFAKNIQVGTINADLQQTGFEISNFQSRSS